MILTPQEAKMKKEKFKKTQKVKVFSFKVKKNPKSNFLHSYSGNFKSDTDAINWYFEKGENLERQFNRDLILVESVITNKMLNNLNQSSI